MKIIGVIAVVLILTAAGAALRRVGSPARYPGPARSRRPAARRQRRSWLVTAAKAAGVNLASDRLSGATAELTGRAAGATVRAGHRRARGGWQWLTALAGRRWRARGDAVRQPLFFTRRRPSGAEDDGGSPAEPGPPPHSTGQPQPVETEPGPADPKPGPDATTTTAPAGAGRKTATMTTRYAINLEPPSTDAEFLESCVDLGDVLRSLAEQISEWAEGLSALHLPQSVLSPLQAVGDGIEEAADGAAKAAAAFCDEFEDARDVAARGMHITGQDAA